MTSSGAIAKRVRQRSANGWRRPRRAQPIVAAACRPRSPTSSAPSFERDRDRILHSKAFRRLKHKTQVFINPDGDHFITRLSHTLQVTQISRSIAAALSLNESLAEAIALGHDVGHSPFGHTGEEALSPYFPGSGWHHAAQSVRIFDVLEHLNLSWEVRDGIRAHSWKIEPPPSTPEAMTVRYGDRIAYLTHDALDAIRAGVLADEDIPGRRARTLRAAGPPVDRRDDQRGHRGEPCLGRGSDGRAHSGGHDRAAQFMFERVYLSPEQRVHTEPAMALIRRLVDYHLDHPDELPDSYRDRDADLTTQVVDYVAGMTDRYAVVVDERLFGPQKPDSQLALIGSTKG